jgi:hypothetical protein
MCLLWRWQATNAALGFCALDRDLAAQQPVLKL